MGSNQNYSEKDPFLQDYSADELRIAFEFLSNWQPFLSRGLCKNCTETLSDRVRSLNPETEGEVEPGKREGKFAVSAIMDLSRSKEDCDCSVGSGKDSVDHNDNADTYSLGSWKDEADGLSEPTADASSNGETSNLLAPLASSKRMSLMQGEENGSSTFVNVHEETTLEEAKPKAGLSREQREYIRFCNVRRKKNFICFERVNGKFVNIVDGLELHTGVFSAAEQHRIVKYVEKLQEMGSNGKLKERTYSAPQKWMRGKGRITLQFGCCYNYAIDKRGNPPGILKNEMVDPLPHLFKVMIKRLVTWHVLPPSCVPDSCIVNIYEEGDCIPPHIDNHDFVRPFCTVSFLSECEILFGSNLKIVGPGDFAGSFAIPLPVGSVLVLSGNGADVSKHCVPAVPTRRISITFRKMDESKQPIGFVPEAELQGLQPLPYAVDTSKNYNRSKQSQSSKNEAVGREEKTDRGRGLTGRYSNARYSGRSRQGPVNRQMGWVNFEK
ncbi:2-oxoglutarate (2OG) and Fe(II)-dependent oxygenase superfamily protein [Abeliophyllum distichum]|uniref:2-oxoglutarate (2OG) and Fe(II)-dependent oxygenase superfamily protein n=1 Tax=Abeliophyllum distichum TaxID=126358 RepID=A0ABD1V522_9LAMI